MEKYDLLIKYMIESFDQEAAPEPVMKGGPFITISREHGCKANSLAVLLCEELSKEGPHWRIMNKEVIQEAAKKLNMEPQKVLQISEGDDRTQMDEVLDAISSKYYKNDRKIKHTIASVIKQAASAGNVIIVGRGGVAITHGMQPAIHIRLYAPVKWRLDTLMSRYHAKREHMLKEITNLDYKRHRWMIQVMKSSINVNDLYDIHFNTSTVSHQQIVAMIVKLLEKKSTAS